MTWIRKEQPSCLDSQPILGLGFVDGNVWGATHHQRWTEDFKYPQITFPSGLERPIWKSEHPADPVIVHVMGELNLPLNQTRDEAYAIAEMTALMFDYLVCKVGDASIEVWRPELDEDYLITYDNEQGAMADIAPVRQEHPVVIYP